MTLGLIILVISGIIMLIASFAESRFPRVALSTLAWSLFIFGVALVFAFRPVAVG